VSLTDKSQFKDYANASILIGVPALAAFSRFWLKAIEADP